MQYSYTKYKVNQEWYQYKKAPQTREEIEPFSINELEEANKSLKAGKDAGYDNIFPEMLMHLGPLARQWLAKFLTTVLVTNKMSKI